jgi:hypothetical protein
MSFHEDILNVVYHSFNSYLSNLPWSLMENCCGVHSPIDSENHIDLLQKHENWDIVDDDLKL